MNIFGRRFRPAWWSFWLTTLGVAVFVSLGNWQLERAAYKQAIKDKFEARLGQEYELFRPEDEWQDIQYRKLILRGRYDIPHNYLLDNQLRAGVAGYHVLTPFKLADSDRVILVNRGWAPWGDTRDPLPAIPPPLHADRVAGIVSFPSKPPLELGDYSAATGWPRLIPFVDFDILRAQYSEQLLPFVLWLAPEMTGQFQREWNPVWLPPEKSRAYATQWFAFAALAVVLFIVLNLRKIE